MMTTQGGTIPPHHAVEEAEALAQCASEPIHIPGHVQANGAIIAVDNETLVITHASDNLVDLTGFDPGQMLGRNLYDVFPEGVRHDLANGMLPRYLDRDTRSLGVVEMNDRTVYVDASAADTSTIFEFTAATATVDQSGKAVRQLELLTSQLQNVDNKDELFATAVKLLQVLTGYHRTMIYAFDADGNGTVLAEALSGTLPSFLGLQFPEWDIPAQARAIMKRSALRYIADVDSAPVPVRAAVADQPPLNMSNSHLRGVSAVHMRYLKNMGTQATLTLPLVVQNELWGMISLHHPAARFPDAGVRQMCRNFAPFFILKLEGLLQRERLDRLLRAEALRKQLIDSASTNASRSMFSAGLLKMICGAMEADGVMLIFDNKMQAFGLCPPKVCMDALIGFGKSCENSFQSSALSRDHAEHAAICGPDIAGLHITALPNDGFVAFFRRDRERETMWAGAPDKDIVRDDRGVRLHPRGSFNAYKMTVRGTSDPWTMEQNQVAGDIWSILINSERKALIEKTTRQQKLLIDELNHRVRNMLTLIRSLSRQSRSSADTIDDYIVTLEARIEAVASAHSLAVEKVGSYVNVHSILAIEAAPYNHDRVAVSVSGTNVGIRPDVAPIFALAVHELMTNAAKYGALSVPGGHLDVSLSSMSEGVRLQWRERGGPAVTPPERVGFGSTLLRKSVPHELAGTYDIRYLPDGVEVDITLPDAILSWSAATDPDIETTNKGEPSEDQQNIKRRAAQTCLLVEDSFVISIDTSRVMNDAGFTNIQTALNAEDGLEFLSMNRPDFAVLDINLSGGTTSFSVADALQEMGVPFVFATGYGTQGVPEGRFPDVPILKKPLRRTDFEAALEALAL